MDSGSQVLNSGFFVTETIIRGILDSLICISNSKAQESRLHSKNLLIQHSTSKNFPHSAIWIVPYMGWFIWNENFFKKFLYPIPNFFFITTRTNSKWSGLQTFFRWSAYILQTFCRRSVDIISRLSADLLQISWQLCSRLWTDWLVLHGKTIVKIDYKNPTSSPRPFPWKNEFLREKP